MPSLGRGFLSNLLGVSCLAATQLAFTPLFLRVVGVGGYAFIGLFITLQAVLQLLDFGFAPTIARWPSRYVVGQEDGDTTCDLARTLEVTSWGVAVMIGFALIAFVPFGKSWFAGNRQPFYHRGARHKAIEIRMFRWPALVWWMPRSNAAKRKVGPRRRWSNPLLLLGHRAIGSYSPAEYDRLIAPQKEVLPRFAARMIASVPGPPLNALARAIMRLLPRTVLPMFTKDLQTSRFNPAAPNWVIHSSDRIALITVIALPRSFCLANRLQVVRGSLRWPARHFALIDAGAPRTVCRLPRQA